MRNGKKKRGRDEGRERGREGEKACVQFPMASNYSLLSLPNGSSILKLWKHINLKMKLKNLQVFKYIVLFTLCQSVLLVQEYLLYPLKMKIISTKSTSLSR